jgi:Arc/MetJ family transcription regulator
MCMEVIDMGVRTNIVLDDQLVNEVKQLTALKTKKDVVDLALNELLKQLKRKKLLSMRHPGLWKGNLAQSRRRRIDTH